MAFRAMILIGAPKAAAGRVLPTRKIDRPEPLIPCVGLNHFWRWQMMSEELRCLLQSMEGNSVQRSIFY